LDAYNSDYDANGDFIQKEYFSALRENGEVENKDNFQVISKMKDFKLLKFHNLNCRDCIWVRNGYTESLPKGTKSKKKKTKSKSKKYKQY
jgi:hypothetical protein